MQNVPSPQEIFLPHTHNPTTSYLHNVVISYSTYATALSPGGSSARSWSKGQRPGGPDFCQWAPGFSFPLCKGDPIDFHLAQLM